MKAMAALMRWLVDNWSLILTAVVAVYGAVLSTVMFVLGRRQQRERIELRHPFWTESWGRRLCVELVNVGHCPVFVRTVELHSPTMEQPITFEASDPDAVRRPTAPGDHRFYEHGRAEVELLVKSLEGAWVTAESTRGKVWRCKGAPAQLDRPS